MKGLNIKLLHFSRLLSQVFHEYAAELFKSKCIKCRKYLRVKLNRL